MKVIMKIEVLGSGCAKCNKLAEATKKVVAELNLDANIEKVEDIIKIMGYGVMSTPALVIDGEVVSSGKLLSNKELRQIFVSRK